MYRKKSLSEKGIISFENVSPNKSSSAKKLPSAQKISEAYENDVFVEFQVYQKAYDRINAKKVDISEVISNASIKKAAAEENNIDYNVNSVVASGDGTWKTRGHLSLIGVCALIAADCGNVLDMEIISSYCKGCDSYKGPNPKLIGSGINVTKIAAFVAACEYNDGCKNRIDLMLALSLKINRTNILNCVKTDKVRKSKAKRQVSKTCFEARKAKKLKILK
ncbi:uncharacterized protein TNCV_1269971 [Trichonephila clavipes]|nr:uncharacterized protein TNCV_1269971 [Trichonephila clavipes]